jgi:AhpC/TSA family
MTLAPGLSYFFRHFGGHYVSRIGGRLLALALAVAALAAGQPKDKPAAPAEQYQALVKVYQDAMQTYSEALGKAKTYEERLKIFDEVYPKPEKLAPRFLDLAEKYPQDPVAFDALTWIVVNCVRSPARIPARAKAVAILSQDHARSEKLGPICQNLANGYDEETAILLTAILDKNPSKDVQAEACVALVQQYGRRLEISQRLHDNPETGSGFARAYGLEAVERLKKADTANLAAQGKRYSKQFAENYLTQMKPDRVAQLCQALSYSTDEVSETLLRTLLEKDSRREVQGLASLTLAQELKRRLEMTPTGGEAIASQVRTESEKLLRRASDQFGDVRLAVGGTVRDKAQLELDDILHLAVGKVAPEIEGQDQDSKKFKLSDYRGKVVLLDFWHQY